MTNFEYLKTLDIYEFSRELSEHFRELGGDIFDRYLSKDKVFYTNIVGYIIGTEPKYIVDENVDIVNKSNYIYITKDKFTKEDFFDFVRHIAVLCKFALITCMEDNIEHHLVIHDGMWDDELVRNFE